MGFNFEKNIEKVEKEAVVETFGSPNRQDNEKKKEIKTFDDLRKEPDKGIRTIDDIRNRNNGESIGTFDDLRGDSSENQEKDKIKKNKLDLSK